MSSLKKTGHNCRGLICHRKEFDIIPVEGMRGNTKMNSYRAHTVCQTVASYLV